ncbi:hypothetical protein HMPREF0454_00721 [Hafnia alvei ATCC 51873]|uniref:Uncharacterized protein n=1 Tax=Hafnia alvei ATCC 51873 TaxID=1002364 RepID=G9Y2A9_HAFAL|nr:hypothetical protein HMPREF0454_00721 [Hafnia alvei ATCC 51873]
MFFNNPMADRQRKGKVIVSAPNLERAYEISRTIDGSGEIHGCSRATA